MNAALDKQTKCELCCSDQVHQYKSGVNKNNSGLLGSASTALLVDPLVRCKSCGVIYTYPRTIEKSDLKQYEEADNLNHQSQDEYRVKTFIKAVKKFNFLSNLKQERVLDIGCATGAFLRALEYLDYTSFEGIEPSKWSVDFINQNYNYEVKNDYFNPTLFNNKFNLIFAWDVIEHVPDPDEFVRDITKILEKNGYVFFNTPNHDSLSRKILKNGWPFYLKVHLYYFNDKSINYLMEKNGFQLIESRSHTQVLGLGYVMYRVFSQLSGKSSENIMIKLRKFDIIPISYKLGQKGYLFKYV